MERALIRLRDPACVVAALLGLALCVGAVTIAQGPGRFTTYAGRATWAGALMALTGLALVAAGITALVARTRSAVGILTTLTGLTWFAPVWVAWQDGPPLIPSLAMVITGFIFALVFHLVVAYPSGKAPTFLRVAVWLVYSEAGLVALALALLRDPYFDPGCLANCTINVFVVRSLPTTVSTIQAADRWVQAVASMALVVSSIVRLATGSRPARRVLAPVLAPGSLFATTVVIRAVELGRDPVERPSSLVFLDTFVVGCIALLLLAAGLIVTVIRMYARRRAVVRIATDLDDAPPPGSLRLALAQALGDPELRVAYPVGHDSRYVDANGKQTRAFGQEREQIHTRLVREGRTIAIVSHASTTTELEAEIGPAVLLALENERLQAELFAELEELQASRVRVVETSDVERRRLERDLHDGAQQRLLALSYDIRLAQRSAQTHGDPEAASLLMKAVTETQVALEELRDVAHGIYPAVLAEAGLAPALATFADTAPIPVVLTDADDRRYPAAVETAAYFAVTEAVEDAARRRASRALVTLASAGHYLTVTIEDDGNDRTAPLVTVSDRVGALNGDTVIEATGCRVEIPCA